MWIFCTVVLMLFWSVMVFHLWRLSRPERQLRLVDNAARRLDLALDQWTGPEVQARLVRREQVALVGVTVLFTVYLPVALLLDQHHVGSSHDDPPLAFMAPLLIVLGARPLLLSALMAIEALHRRRSPGERIARALVPAITDYVRPVEVWSARLLATVAVPLCSLVAWQVQAHQASQPWLSTAGLAATAASGPLLLAIVELGVRRLLALPQPAATPIELAWDDAIRSMQLRELYTVVTGASVIISALTVAVLEISMIPAYAAVLVIVLLGFAGKPASHYRRRLWPTPNERTPA